VLGAVADVETATGWLPLVAADYETATLAADYETATLRLM
jgi:hypothetical protein